MDKKTLKFTVDFPWGSRTNFRTKIQNYLDGNIVDAIYKVHTLREETDIQPGEEIELNFMDGLPNIKVNITSVQRITIKWHEDRKRNPMPTIIIDDKSELNFFEISFLSDFDGFENFREFFAYFKDGFDGYIINWGAYKY